MKENQQVGWIDYHNIQLSGYDFLYGRHDADVPDKSFPYVYRSS